jgi:hypothetical protein
MTSTSDMHKPTRQITILTFILLLVTTAAAQKEKGVPACKESTFAVMKAVPKLEYECPEGAIESDDKILRLPQRRTAINKLIRELTAFNDALWWQADVNELNACKIHGSGGELTDEEKSGWRQGDYTLELQGNNQMRLVLTDDPCYQTGYSGANAFLLYRKDGKVFVSQVLNGYYSRVDNSVGINFANVNGQQLVEITTANSMPPSLMNYYFVIDPKTNLAVPKNIFREGGRPRNTVYSAMLMNEPQDLGLPKEASELNIVRNHRLAPTFSAYEEDDKGKIDSNGRKMRRIVYRWNGSFYTRAR